MKAPRLLIADLDGTLLGDDRALERFGRWFETRQEQVRLVYNSGRFFEAVDGLIDSTPLPGPDAVIGGLGTEINFYPDGSTVEGWPPCGDRFSADRVREVLAGYGRLRLQPAPSQGKFKLSYDASDLEAPFLDELRSRLKGAGQDVEIFCGSGGELHFLPAGANKGLAADFLVTQWRLHPSQVVVAGDTGDDLSMFRCGFRGIVVANAHPELRSLVHADVYHSPQPHADGVVDGMTYWTERLRGGAFPSRRRRR